MANKSRNGGKTAVSDRMATYTPKMASLTIALCVNTYFWFLSCGAWIPQVKFSF